MKFWRLEEKRHFPNKPINCNFCGSEMLLRWSKIFSHCDYLHEAMRRKDAGEDVEEFMKMMDEIPSAYSYADDMQWKCPECGSTQLFGVAISLEQFKNLRKARGYGNMYIPIQEWNDDIKIKQQLKALGYWGG